MRRVWLVLWFGVCVASCGDSPTGPTGNQVVDVAGIWNYASTLTTVTSSDCIGTSLQANVGTTEVGTMSITQNGAALTATTRSNTDGTSCTYTGTAGSGSISLGWTSCDAAIRTGFTCTDGQRRDVRMASNAINATVSGSMGPGTQAQTYNVTVNGTGAAAGILTLNGSFRATR